MIVSMNLKNVRVLVDGYNLELLKGTGIKTYGITLIKALTSLKAEIDVLYSNNIKPAKQGKNAIEEILFFDPNYQKKGYLNKIISAIKIITQFSFTPYRLELGDVVIPSCQDILNSQFVSDIGIEILPSCYQISNNSFKIINRELVVQNDRQCHIFHATYPLPIKVKGAKKITTIHDLIPCRLPYLTLDNKDFFYRLVKHSIKTSDLIITVSEHSKKDLVEIFKCPSEKIAVTYQPIALKKQQDSAKNLAIYLLKYKLKYQKYLLFVGAIEPKKNLGNLIDAYAMTDTDLPLVIVGKKAWLWEKDLDKINFLFREQDSQKTESKKVIVLDYVPTEDLQYLFQGAYCFIFPSFYEGFGLPPLEAMSLGCPVITSKVASLPEVCGDAALYIDPYNTEDLREKIQQILVDRELRDRLSKAGIKRAEFFNMDNYQERLINAYNQVLKK